MFPRKKANQGKDEFDEPNRSYHDLLSTRSKEFLTPRKRGLAGKIATLGSGNGIGIGFLEMIAEVVIFAGGVAFGAGVLLLYREDPTSSQGRAAVAIGLGFVVVTILVRGLLRLRSRPWTSAARTN